MEEDVRAHGCPSRGDQRDEPGRASHPKLLAREALVTYQHLVTGSGRVVGAPVRQLHMPGGVRIPAHLLGQHADRVLRGRLGLDDDSLKRLRRAGVIGGGRRVGPSEVT